MARAPSSYLSPSALASRPRSPIGATRLLPSMLTVLSPAPVLFLAFFLFFSDVSKLVLPEDETAVEASVGGDTPVVFVVLDEFSGLHLLDRSGRINGARFPNFARLARTSDWYPNATTVSDRTDRAVPAILTGTRPSANKLPIVSDYPENLFTLLGGDYRARCSGNGLPHVSGQPLRAGAGADRDAPAIAGTRPAHRGAAPSLAGRPRERPPGGQPHLRKLRRKRRSPRRCREGRRPGGAPGAGTELRRVCQRGRDRAQPSLPSHPPASYPMAVPPVRAAVRGERSHSRPG